MGSLSPPSLHKGEAETWWEAMRSLSVSPQGGGRDLVGGHAVPVSPVSPQGGGSGFIGCGFFFSSFFTLSLIGSALLC